MENIRVIILCGGEAVRWQNHLGAPKQLVEIDGVRLLDQTIAQARAMGVNDIHVIGNGSMFARQGAEYHDCREEPFASNMFHKIGAAFPLWNVAGPTAILFGDVWYSSTTIKTLLSPSEGLIKMVGRLFPSSFTGCNYGEMFGLNFGPDMHAIIRDGISKLPKAGMSAARLYYELRSELSADHSAQIVLVNIDDATDDFDFPIDLEKWLERQKQNFAVDQSTKGFQLHDWVKLIRRKWQRRLYVLLPSTAIIAFFLGFVVQMTLSSAGD